MKHALLLQLLLLGRGEAFQQPQKLSCLSLFKADNHGCGSARAFRRPHSATPHLSMSIATTDAMEDLDNASNKQEEIAKRKATSLSMNDDEDTSKRTTTTFPKTPTFRECLAFTLPALGIYICSPLMSLIDASFIGNCRSHGELAALGPASTISDSAPLPLLFLSIAATNLIAQGWAKKDQETITRVSRISITMGFVGSIGLTALLLVCGPPLSALYCGASGTALVPACSQYVKIRALALPAVVVTTIAQAICIGTQDTRTPMISVALAGLLNLVGDFLWVPKYGIAGAAWATSLSQVVAAGLLMRVLKKRGFLGNKQPQVTSEIDSSATSSQESTAPTTTSTTTVKQLLSFLPFLFVMAVKMGWHNSCSATAASLGGVQAAAHTALLSVAMVCMVLGDVGSSLSQAFLPAFAVAGQQGTSSFDMERALPTIKQLLKCTLSISSTVVVLASIVIGVFAGKISSDAAVVAEMKRALPWIVTTLSFHGSAVTLEGLLLSRKKFRSLAACYSVLAVTVVGFQWATRKFSLGLAGVWGCYAFFCCARVVAFSALGGLLSPSSLSTLLPSRFRRRATKQG